MSINTVHVLIENQSNGKQWVIATMLRETKDKVFVTYGTYWNKISGKAYEWIPNNPNKVRNIESTTFTILSSNSNYYAFTQQEPTPIYFKSKTINNHYIITSNTNGVYLYNIQTKQQKLVSDDSFPSNIKPMVHALDKEHNLLYILGHSAMFGTVNLNDKTWNLILLKSQSIISDLHPYYSHRYEFVSSVFIPSPINELHVIQGCKHKKYAPKQQRFIHVGNIWGRGHNHDRLFYIESMKKMFLFRGSNIYFCDIKASDEIWYKWKKFPIDLPPISHSMHIILIQKHVAVIYSDDDIYCVDLLYHRLALSNKMGPTLRMYGGGMIACNNNTVHYIPRNGHYKWSLREVIPNAIKELHRKRKYDPLIHGFIKCEEEKNDINIPFYLKNIVLAFYPSHFDC